MRNKNLILISKIYNIKIILFFILIFILTFIEPIQVFPDYFNLSKITDPFSYIFRLISIVVGSSSIILTILIVLYSSLSKTFKRSSFKFIYSNPWIKYIFSFFLGSFLFLGFSLIAINIENYGIVLSLLYISSFITFIYIIAQFPLLLLALKYNNSDNAVKRLIEEISFDDKVQLTGSFQIGKEITYEVLEQNRLILLKEIGKNAIKEQDWSLPQQIINDLFRKLISGEKENYKPSSLNIQSFLFVCNHLLIEAFKNSDIHTIPVIASNLFETHKVLTKRKVDGLLKLSLNQSIIDMQRQIIVDNTFYNIQNELTKHTSTIIKNHISSIKYSDEELPTQRYRINNTIIESGYKLDNARENWIYVKEILPKIFFKPIEMAIELKNKNFYEKFNWRTQDLLEHIKKAENLTTFQKGELFEEYFDYSKELSSLAISHNIFKDINILSGDQIVWWLADSKDNNIYNFLPLWYFGNLMKTLNNQNHLASSYLFEFCEIGRGLCLREMLENVKIEGMQYVEEIIFEIYNNTSDENLKKYIKEQMNWFRKILKENNYDILNFEFV